MPPVVFWLIVSALVAALLATAGFIVFQRRS
jgi:hypothetical protein